MRGQDTGQSGDSERGKEVKGQDGDLSTQESCDSCRLRQSSVNNTSLQHPLAAALLETRHSIICSLVVVVAEAGAGGRWSICHQQTGLGQTHPLELLLIVKQL
jgi:hypothetical protein